jgi:prepilin-type processing-associated H-X9-DG protein
MWDSDVYRKSDPSDSYCYPDWWTLKFWYLRHGDTENAWYLDGHATTENESSGALDSSGALFQLHAYNKIKW